MASWIGNVFCITDLVWFPNQSPMDSTHWKPGISRWRHQMEKFSALLAISAGKSPVTWEFPAQRPVTRSFDVFFDLRLNDGWANYRDLRHRRTHYDIIVMVYGRLCFISYQFEQAVQQTFELTWVMCHDVHVMSLFLICAPLKGFQT